jgi:beta-glucosidase
MMKHVSFRLISASVAIAISFSVSAQYKIYNLPKKSIYKNGWIDLNKNGKKDVYEDRNADIEDRIDDLLSQMTIEEKTCQMVTLYGYGRVLKDDLPNEGWKKELWKDGIGNIDEHLNGFQQWGLPPSNNPYVWPASKHAWALNEVQRFFIEETRLGIPVDFTNEGIRGVESYKATNFPTQLGLGTTWDRDLIEKVGNITGREARLLGYTNVYAPILDVGRDQRWGRYEEVYGECPFLVAELGVRMVKGMQRNYQVASTSKHYLAYSNNKGAREGMSRVDPQMSLREVENIHLYPWKRVIRDAGLLGVMSSYNDYDGFPIESSSYWLTDILRKLLGFKGYIISDSDAVEYLFMKHNTAADMKDAVLQSVMAGLNVRCTFRSPDSYVLPLRELINEGKIDISVINDRVRDVLRVKFLTGEFDRPYQMDLAAADKEVNCAENQKIALQTSLESIVLLKNADNLLPLNKNLIKKIAVCGPNANDPSYALTHYGPLAVDVKTVYQGIVDKVGKEVQVTYSKGCDIVDENWPESEIIDFPLTPDEKRNIDIAVKNAQESDVAVVVLGENSRTCGENKSRSSIDLAGRQLDLLKAVYATGKPVVLILINGRPLSVNWAEKYVPAILEAWYPGSQGGTAIADVLFGDYNPGGKLTVTFPKSVGQIPFNFPQKPNSQVDVGSKPGLNGNMTSVNGFLYPFGFGMSYTKFKYSDLSISQENISNRDSLTVSCKITNTGLRAGDEVVQLYTRDLLSSVTTYEKNLRGFERIHLNSGETKTVLFTIIPEYLELFNAENKWVVEPGDFKVMIGASSEDIRLEGNFTVIDENCSQRTESGINSANELTVTSDPISDSVRNITDSNPLTCWYGEKDNSFTITLPAQKKINTLNIYWGDKTDIDAEFEIQLSKGGGQFMDFYPGKLTDLSESKIKIDESGISDIRIIIMAKKVYISKVEIK